MSQEDVSELEAMDTPRIRSSQSLADQVAQVPALLSPIMKDFYDYYFGEIEKVKREEIYSDRLDKQYRS